MKRRFKFIFAAFLVLLTFLLALPCGAVVTSEDPINDYVNSVPFSLYYRFGGLKDSSAYDYFDDYSLLDSFSYSFVDPAPTGVNYIGGYTDSRSPLDDNSYRLGYYNEFFIDYTVGNHNIPWGLLYSDYYDRMSFTNLFYNEEGNFAGTSCVESYIEVNPFFVEAGSNFDYYAFRLSAQNFSSWIDADGHIGSELYFHIPAAAYVADPEYPDQPAQELFINSIIVNYSIYGSDTVYTTSLDYDSMPCWPFIGVTPDILGFTDYGTYIYIHDINIDLSITDYQSILDGYRLVIRTYNTFNPILFDYSYGGFRPGTMNPAIPLLDYTDWLATASSGFLDLELFPNFTLGGIFMTVLAFVCVVWFLKLVAGG